MNTKNLQKVISASGILRAVAIQSTLERAGIQATVIAPRSGTYLDILVPAESALDAMDLLAPERYCGEIFYAPQQS